ncbi:putative NIPA-like protein 2-like isoform X2 [Capsicum annuum]|nr:putative NIPA-like protein 2-like isoform X2 [Capsicum annuum]
MIVVWLALGCVDLIVVLEKVIKAYAFNKAWIFGLLMDLFGAVLMLRALSLAPVSVIQPVSGCGLAILSVFSHFYLKEIMNVIDWIGITLAGIGTIGNVYSNVLELSNQYNALLWDVKNEALALYMRLDERKKSKKLQGESNEDVEEVRNRGEDLLYLCECPWVFCGDFYTSGFLYERRKCITNAMVDFLDWIEDMELFNPPLYKGRFTWLRGISHYSAARLDKFLFSGMEGNF